MNHIRYAAKPKMTRVMRTDCRICGGPIEAFMTFGQMPIANGFLTADAFAQEYFFELAPAVCGSCGMFQIVEQPAPEKMFHANYAFFSSTSVNMLRHFRELAELLFATYLAPRKDPLIIELGSNDGILLRNLVGRPTRHLGIEPSANVAEAAVGQGVNTLCAFFGSKLAEDIRAQHGSADVIVASNVICHIPDFNDLIRGVATLLSPEGVFVFEDPYLGDVIEKTSYDQIYDEHVFLFSAHSVQRGVAPLGLQLIDAEPAPTHGGSMRYTMARSGARPCSPRVEALLARERDLGLTDAGTFERFRANCEASKTNLVALLERLNREGRRVAGYGATSKSTTILNYCGIGAELIEFISDTTPTKIDKFTPGMHVPVCSYASFAKKYPDYALLFAWNHSAEILPKERKFTEAGGQWITYVPEVRIFR